MALRRTNHAHLGARRIVFEGKGREGREGREFRTQNIYVILGPKAINANAGLGLRSALASEGRSGLLVQAFAERTGDAPSAFPLMNAMSSIRWREQAPETWDGHTYAHNSYTWDRFVDRFGPEKAQRFIAKAKASAGSDRFVAGILHGFNPKSQAGQELFVFRFDNGVIVTASRSSRASSD